MSRVATAQDTSEPWVTAFGAPQYFAVSVADPDGNMLQLSSPLGNGN